MLRDRLTAAEAVDLGAQLPTLVRGFYYDGWRPSDRPTKFHHKENFVRRVTELYPGLADADSEKAVRAVFSLLSSHITDGELKHVRDQLPPDVRSLWELLP